jgi:response regulator RpfG family c-di-GMP phosphodiesterase
MDQNTSQKRLDEILIELGLITEEKIKEALDRQKLDGVKLGSQLLYHKYIDEADLVKALSIKNNCKGVILSDYAIHELIIKMIPQRVAISRKVMPFDYNPEKDILKIACSNPHQPNLINELQFLAKGKRIELYVAVEIVLNTVIARYYLGKIITDDDNYLLEIPDTNESSSVGEKEGAENPAVLIVIDDDTIAPLLEKFCQYDNYDVKITDSADDAIEMLGNDKFESLLIKDTVAGDYIDLIERVRKISPRTTVHYFDKISSLLLGDSSTELNAELNLKNLDLFTSLLTSKSKLMINHSGRVGKYVDKLCDKLGIPEKDKMLITTAAYMHDFAKFYYSSEKIKDDKQTVPLTVKLLSSLNYSPVITEMLRTMYLDLKGKYTKRLPIEVLGGNIITIVDLFCESIPRDELLAIDKFEKAKKKLYDLVGKLFLREVVDAFVAMIHNELLERHAAKDEKQVLIFAEDNKIQETLETQLSYEGLRTVALNSIDVFIELYHRSKPDMIVLVSLGTPDYVMKFVDQLDKGGIKFKELPVFLLVEDVCVPRLTSLFSVGIEDIIPYNDSLNLLTGKTRKIKLNMAKRSKEKDERKQTATPSEKINQIK